MCSSDLCNDFSIGVELEGTDDCPYTLVQYRQLARLTLQIRQRYPIEGIAGHCDIAPDRKTDPGAAFDWHDYRSRVSRLCKGNSAQTSLIYR